MFSPEGLVTCLGRCKRTSGYFDFHFGFVRVSANQGKHSVSSDQSLFANDLAPAREDNCWEVQNPHPNFARDAKLGWGTL